MPLSSLPWSRAPAIVVGGDNQPERICVLGGGFGGLYAALRLQKMPWRGRRPTVTLVDKRDKFTFLPLLYEFASESSGEIVVWGGGERAVVRRRLRRFSDVWRSLCAL